MGYWGIGGKGYFWCSALFISAGKGCREKRQRERTSAAAFDMIFIWRGLIMPGWVVLAAVCLPVTAAGGERKKCQLASQGVSTITPRQPKRPPDPLLFLLIFLLCGRECRSDICSNESISKVNGGGLFGYTVTVTTVEYWNSKRGPRCSPPPPPLAPRTQESLFGSQENH